MGPWKWGKRQANRDSDRNTSGADLQQACSGDAAANNPRPDEVELLFQGKGPEVPKVERTQTAESLIIREHHVGCIKEKGDLAELPVNMKERREEEGEAKDEIVQREKPKGTAKIEVSKEVRTAL